MGNFQKSKGYMEKDIEEILQLFKESEKELADNFKVEVS